MISIIFICACLFSSVIGSFLNVIIFRYPVLLNKKNHKECLEFLNILPQLPSNAFNLAHPRSHCTYCKNAISPRHNIPILSYFILKKKCKQCKKSISPIYPLVEIISALAPILILLHFGITMKSLFAIIFTWGMLVLSFIDIREKILPDIFTYSLLWLGLLLSLFSFFTIPYLAILGATIGYLTLWFIAKFFKLIRKIDGMGHGDFKMLAMLGAWVGVNNLLNIILIAAILALAVGVILILRKKMISTQPIPFGPFLAISGWLTLMYGSFFIRLTNGIFT